jgi:hypothetical protein
LVAFTIVFSAAIYLPRARDWNKADAVYKSIGARISYLPSAIVMVNNPPGYVYHTGQPAIAIPNGDVDTLLAVARRYGATWVALEANHPIALDALYEYPQSNSYLVLVETFVSDNKPVYLLGLIDH